MGMLCDMHCHLLPGVDDGAVTMEEAIEALNAEYQEGVRKIIFTPHFSEEKGMCTSEELQKVFDEVKSKVQKEKFGKRMTLALGQELMYTEELPTLLKEKKILTMAGSQYVLIEFLPTVRYQQIYDSFRMVGGMGYWPILAHMERYECLDYEYDLVEELIEMGGYMQVNASSLTRRGWDKKTHYIKKLTKDGNIHFLGTDSHGVHYRAPEIKNAAVWILEHCSQEISKRILYENPQALWEDKMI